MKKNLVLLLMFVLSSNIFAQTQTAQIKKMEDYVKRIMELTSEGENNSWLILDAFAEHMREGSVVFELISEEAKKGDDRSRYLLGKYYLGAGKYEDAIKWLGKITNERYRNARFMLAVSLMHKACRTGSEEYFLGASEVLKELRKVKVEAFSNVESINFLLKACESGTPERKIFKDSVK